MKSYRYLLAALFFALPTGAAAQCSGIFPAGSVCGNPGVSSGIAKSAPTSGSIAFSGGSLVNTMFVDGARYLTCNGTNETTGMNLALTAAAGKTLILPAGICVHDFVTPLANTKIVGQGRGVTTLRRLANSTQGALYYIEASGVSFENVTIDGNKANQTIGAISVWVAGGGQFSLSNSDVTNAKWDVVNGGGAGLYILDSTDGANGVRSVVSNSTISGNESSAIAIEGSWGVRLTGNVIKSNASATSAPAVKVEKPASPPLADQQDWLTITENEVSNNASVGISVYGNITSVTGGGAYIFGNGNPDNVVDPVTGTTGAANTNHMVIANNFIRNNGTYGLAYSGFRGLITGNDASGNGTGGAFTHSADYLVGGAYITFTGNISTNGYTYGLDSGGCYSCTFSGNNFITPGQSGAPFGAGIGAGAGQNNTFIGNNVVFGSFTTHGISMPGSDGSSASAPFPWLGYGTTISNNRIDLRGTDASCIEVTDLYGSAKVNDNLCQTTRTGTLTAPWKFEVTSIIQSNNVVSSGITNFPASGSLAVVQTVPSASTLVLPDGGDRFYVSGTTTIDTIFTYSQNAYTDKIYGVQMSAYGSGYDPNSPPSVTFSGHGCGTPPAGTAKVDGGGRVIGVTMTNRGVGCTANGTVTFAAGATTATGTPVFRVSNASGRLVTLFFQGGPTTINTGSNQGWPHALTANSTDSIVIRGDLGSGWQLVAGTNTDALNASLLSAGTLAAVRLPVLGGGDVSCLTAGGNCTLASVISAAGPIGGATSIPIITYDAKGRLTTVTTATPTVTTVNGVSYPASFTSGGILYASSTSAVASSALLTANAIVLGGGAGVAPATLGSLGTTTTVLHGNAAGAPTFGAVSLTADVTAILPGANGGTNNAFFQVSGPATSTKTFTFPNANETVAALGQSQTYTGNNNFSPGSGVGINLGGNTTPQMTFTPSSGATRTGQIYQSGDVWHFGASGVGDSFSLDLANNVFGSIGGRQKALRTVTAAGAITAAKNDHIICVNKSVGAATAVNLFASPATGTEIIVKDCKADAAANNITVTPAAGNIDGAGTAVININRGLWWGVYNGSEWSTLKINAP